MSSAAIERHAMNSSTSLALYALQAASLKTHTTVQQQQRSQTTMEHAGSPPGSICVAALCKMVFGCVTTKHKQTYGENGAGKQSHCKAIIVQGTTACEGVVFAHTAAVCCAQPPCSLDAVLCYVGCITAGLASSSPVRPAGSAGVCARSQAGTCSAQAPS